MTITKKIWKLAAALAVTAAVLPAQRGAVAGSGFQQAGQMSLDEGGWRTLPVGRGGRGAAQVVVGKPVSGTEERKTVQTLADGTLIENSDSDVFYRDAQGRTRVEQSMPGRAIVITDPVAHISIVLDPTTKTARKNPVTAFVGQLGTQGTQVGTRSGQASQGVVFASRGGTMVTDSEAYSAGVAAGRAAAGRAGADRAAAQNPPPTSEELGVQTMNGVAAQGIRSTQTIPAGRIGNNRDIHVVNERWYSSDLQLLVKTVNSDPRFGVTTYQLLNIVQGTQDPSLFQIPSDYTVVER
jgi:hypothetical protein